MIDLSPNRGRKYNRKKNGMFKKNSGFYRWRKKKNRPFGDYSPYLVGIFGLITWMVCAQIIPVYAHIKNETGFVEILNREASLVDVAESASKSEGGDTGTVVSAVVQEDEDEGRNLPIAEKASPSNESIKQKIRKAWEGTGQEDIAVAIATSESGLNTNAKGDIQIQYWHEGKLIGHSCGIFQIRVLPSRPSCEELKDPDKNIEFARKLWEKSGWYPWSNFKNGVYKKFL